MKEILICLYGLALIMCGVAITFKLLKVFYRHAKNHTFKKWVVPIISGLIGACFIVGVLLIGVWIYSNVGFLREFIDAIVNLDLKEVSWIAL